MDVGSFAMQFSPHDEGLVSILAGVLLRDRFEAKDIQVELYKLNVYGKTCQCVALQMSPSHD